MNARITCTVPLHPELQARIAIIEQEDFSSVMRKAKEELEARGQHPSDDYLESGIHALKQYYAIALLDPANPHAVPAPVDPFWHSHILHTEQYVAFCHNLVGDYMHHRPLDRTDTHEVERMRTLYGYTLSTLPKLFADVDATFWPNDLSDGALICHHKGNQAIYREVQPFRLFEPVAHLQ